MINIVRLVIVSPLIHAPPPVRPSVDPFQNHQQRYEAIDFGKAVDTSLPEAELAADRAEKDALLKDGQTIVAAAEKLIAETKVRSVLALLYSGCGVVGSVLALLCSALGVGWLSG